MTIRYVNTASTAGGDGTTNETTGATRAFVSLLDAINSLPAALLDAYTIYCEGSAADTSALSQTPFDFVTTPTNYLLVTTTPANRHDGKWNTSKYRIEVTNTNAIYCNIGEHIRFDGLQLQVTCNDSSSYVCLKTTNANQTGLSVDMRVSNCIVKAVISGAGSAVTGFNSRPTTGGAGTTKCWNGLAIDCTNGVNNDFPGAEYYNITIQSDTGTKYGVVADGDTICVNVLSKASSIDFVGGANFNAACKNNASADGSAPGTNSRNTQTFTFVNEGADDFHLALTDAGAQGFGFTDPASGLFLDDIDGQTRSAPWDIGADDPTTSRKFLLVRP